MTTRLVSKTQSATIASSEDCIPPPNKLKVVATGIAKSPEKRTQIVTLSRLKSTESDGSSTTAVLSRETTPSPWLADAQVVTPPAKRLSRKERYAELLQSTLIALCNLSNLLYRHPRAFELKNGNEEYFGKLLATELQRMPLEERRRKKLAILQILFEKNNP
uniref:BESS domain-containing protein n=1 Tax=Bracon brevicornis TaxID=1563983 RepID=A0A6V7JCS7_9HYME